MLYYFDLQSTHSDAQYQAMRLSVDRTAKDWYGDYKYKPHCHFKNEGPNVLYKNVSTADWQKCVDLYTSEKFVVSILLNYYFLYNFFFVLKFCLTCFFVFCFFFHRNIPAKIKLIGVKQSIVVCTERRPIPQCVTQRFNFNFNFNL